MNEVFLKRIEQMLGAQQTQQYVQTLSQPVYRGLRVNTLKIGVDQLRRQLDLPLTPSPFAPEGLIAAPSCPPLGNTIEHRQGLFYLQEPSASSAVTVLDPQPGEWVLDLCAAPGGKSTQIAARLNHEGYLISNEIDPARARILLSNCERLGVGEATLTCASPDQLCQAVCGWMDKVLVDAPCSGEGMFKKEDQALQDWSVEHVHACARRQRKILDCAYHALKQEGILVYSTCTYSREENEEVIASFLADHPDMELLDCAVDFGRPGVELAGFDSSRVRRIWPMDGGEGHFIARLRRLSANPAAAKKTLPERPVPAEFSAFLEDQLTEIPPLYKRMCGDQAYIQRHPFFELKKIRVLRQGIQVGELMKNRLEPHQHFYTAALLDGVRRHQISLDSKQLQCFLKGEALNLSAERGYVCLAFQSYPVGFGKSDGQQIKNKYPKGLRLR